MVDRRTFTTLLAAAITAPATSFGQGMARKNLFYSAVGPELTCFGVDVENTALTRQATVSVPANIQYAWPHPSRKFLYVVSSDGGPGASGVTGKTHAANAFTVDANGALTPVRRACEAAIAADPHECRWFRPLSPDRL